MESETDTIVTAQWLNGSLHRKDIAVFDCTWGLNKTDSYDNFLSAHIPGARFFDIDKIADTSVNLPHMLPSVDFFEATMSSFGIRKSDHAVVYDRSGMYVASARVWWTFKAFGHKKVSVLEGGLGAWQANKFPIEKGPAKPAELSVYKADFQPKLVRNLNEVLEEMKSKKQIVDARSRGRFTATEPEPRPHLRGGHIPGSKNVPFGEILIKKHPDDEFLVFQAPEKIKKVFLDNGIDPEKPVTTSCGSGVTASVLALGLHLTGNEKYAVYDGSWSEYGLPEKANIAPVATKANE